jgi:hypothetical protein
LRNQAKTNIKKYIDERLPEEYGKCMVGLNAITREAWNTSQNTEDKREKIQALSLAKECYSMKLELLTNATMVDNAIRFVSDKTKEKIKSSNNNEDDKESNEPDYDDEDEDQLEEKGQEVGVQVAVVVAEREGEKINRYLLGQKSKSILYQNMHSTYIKNTNQFSNCSHQT